MQNPYWYFARKNALTIILDSTDSRLVPKYEVKRSQSQNHLSPKGLTEKLQQV